MIMLLSQLYRQLSIRVVLTEAITWTNGDRITINPDPNTLLNTFRAEQRNVISSQYDSAMLMTCVCSVQIPIVGLIHCTFTICF